MISEPCMREFICRVDAVDRITFVDESWVPFAVENGLPSLTAGSVSGRLLWDYVSEPISQQLYRMLAGKVRKTGRALDVPFRCDAPECRRFMKMIIQPLAGGGLEFRSVLLREEARPRMELFNVNFPRNNDYLTVCAWCKKVRASRWLEVEEAVRELRLFDQPRLPRITHGVCPDCEQAINAETLS